MIKNVLIISLFAMLIANYNCAFSNGMSSTGCPSTCKLANNCLCKILD